MVDPAPANAVDATLPAQRQGRPPPMGVREAAEITGLSVSTVQRRVDAWVEGNRSDYALKGGRAGTKRYCDPDDVGALALQLRGELGRYRHPEDPERPPQPTEPACGA